MVAYTGHYSTSRLKMSNRAGELCIEIAEDLVSFTVIRFADEVTARIVRPVPVVGQYRGVLQRAGQPVRVDQPRDGRNVPVL